MHSRFAPRRAPLALAVLPLAAVLATACSEWGDEGEVKIDSGILPYRPDAAPVDAADAAVAQPDASADAATADGGADAGDGGLADTGVDAGPSTFTVSGRITFDWVPAKDDVSEGGVRLDYDAIEERPARRIVVQAMPMLGTRPIAETLTDDLGGYTLEVPNGRSVKIRAVAETRGANNVPDGIPPDRCDGATWRARVVDNTADDATYVLDSSATISTAATVNVHARLTYRNGEYRDRTAPPFAIIDVLIRELELLCEGIPNASLPLLVVNWSENNVPWSGDFGAGEIGTSFYSGSGGTSNLYILGKSEIDTDEYDDHVIAHETGHYFEDRLYRSDSQGGGHSDGDTLDLATAFGEGFGNGISGMVFDDPVYVDTSSGAQSGGFAFDVSAAPEGDDRGVYSETSVQYLLWTLYENRDATPHSGSYDHIHQVLRDYQRNTDAVTSAQSFAAYYNQLFGGDAESLASVWQDGLGTPYDSLCAGPCTRTGDVADPFDVDNDVGLEYAGVLTSTTPRHYPQGSSHTYPPEFWQLYRTLSSGTSSTAHDQTAFSSDESPGNRFGGVRWYRYVGTGQSVRISVRDLVGATCSEDVLDMAVYDRGREVDRDYSRSGCPEVVFSAVNGRNYVIILFGLDTHVPRWAMEVSP